MGGMKINYPVLALSLFVALGAPSARQPNIVFILADDLGYAELGCYGQEKIKTPRIDALAAEGMRFTRAYSGNAVCAPSRCVLMTGKHPGHAIVRNNKGMKPEGQYPIPDAETTLAEVLGKAGYVSGAFGKWGLGNTQSTGNPNRQGFNRFFGYNCQSHAHSYYPATLWSDEEKVALKNHPPVPGHAGLRAGTDPKDPASYDIFKGQDYAPDRINEQALAFVRAHKDKPFFLYYPSVIPHVALHVPDENLKPYLAEKWEDPPFTRDGGGYTPHFTPRAAYAAMITRLDTYVGRLLDLLVELGVADNTIVVFTSDNGTTHLRKEVDYKFFASVGALRGLKGSLYEGGVRVPLIVRWPGRIKAGSVSHAITGFEDWMPTLVDLVEAKGLLPAGLDGESIAPALLGGQQPARKFLYREFTGYGGQQAIWVGKWKAIRQNMLRKKKNVDPLRIELYDLEADVSEARNVSAAHPEVVAKLRQLMGREHRPSEVFPFPVLDKTL